MLLSDTRIPKLIHISKEASKDIINAWRKRHPKFDVRVYDETDQARVIKEMYDRLREEMPRRRTVPTNAWRYACLFTSGGIWIDAQTKPGRSIDSWNLPTNCRMAVEAQNDKASIIMSAPRQKECRKMVERLLQWETVDETRIWKEEIQRALDRDPQTKRLVNDKTAEQRLQDEEKEYADKMKISGTTAKADPLPYVQRTSRMSAVAWVLIIVIPLVVLSAFGLAVFWRGGRAPKDVMRKEDISKEPGELQSISLRQ